MGHYFLDTQYILLGVGHLRLGVELGHCDAGDAGGVQTSRLSHQPKPGNLHSLAVSKKFIVYFVHSPPPSFEIYFFSQQLSVRQNFLSL